MSFKIGDRVFDKLNRTRRGRITALDDGYGHLVVEMDQPIPTHMIFFSNDLGHLRKKKKEFIKTRTERKIITKEDLRKTYPELFKPADLSEKDLSKVKIEVTKQELRKACEKLVYHNILNAQIFGNGDYTFDKLWDILTGEIR